jgi:hypothetical protein
VLCNGKICLTVVIKDRSVKCGVIQKEEPIPWATNGSGDRHLSTGALLGNLEGDHLLGT